MNATRHNFKLGYSDPANDIDGGDSFQANSDIANMKDFEDLTSVSTPVRTRSMSPTKEPFLRSPTLLNSKALGSSHYDSMTPRPFQATKQVMKNLKNDSSSQSETGHQRRITAGPLSTQNRTAFIPHSVSPVKSSGPSLTF